PSSRPSSSPLSFPTRRSSDLLLVPWHVLLQIRDPSFLYFYIVNEHILRFLNRRDPIDYIPLSLPAFWLVTLVWLSPWSLFLVGRSEEHTSELQSRGHLVCRLL